MATEGIRVRMPDLATATPAGRLAGVFPLTGAVSLLVTAAALLYAALNAAVPGDAIFWGGLALAAYLYGLIFLVAAILGPAYSPARWRFGPWMLLWAGTMYGLSTTTLDQAQSTVAAQIVQANVLRALWLVAAGLTLWFVGYMIGPGRLSRKGAARAVNGLRRRYSPDVRSPLTPWLLYGIGTVARLASALATGRLGYTGDVASSVTGASSYGQVLTLLCYFGQVGLAVAALQVFRERMPSARLTLVILFLCEIGYAVASGAKESYALAVLAVIIPYAVGKKRLPMWQLAVVAVIFLGFVVPFTTAYRTAVRESSSGILSTGQALDAVPQVLRSTLSDGDSLLTAIPGSLGDLLARGQDIDASAIIMQRTPGQIPYVDPVQLVTGPLTALIPRAVWPDKPILDTGYQFGQQYYEIPASVYSSETMTPIGDLYRHGGWLPVLIGMFVLGCGVRLLDDFVDVRDNPHMISLALFLLPSLTMSEQDWITLLGGIPALIALWWLSVALTFRKRRSAA
jgi:hypothetical protein